MRFCVTICAVEIDWIETIYIYLVEVNFDRFVCARPPPENVERNSILSVNKKGFPFFERNTKNATQNETDSET